MDFVNIKEQVLGRSKTLKMKLGQVGWFGETGDIKPIEFVELPLPIETTFPLLIEEVSLFLDEQIYKDLDLVY